LTVNRRAGDIRRRRWRLWPSQLPRNSRWSAVSDAVAIRRFCARDHTGWCFGVFPNYQSLFVGVTRIEKTTSTMFPPLELSHSTRLTGFYASRWCSPFGIHPNFKWRQNRWEIPTWGHQVGRDSNPFWLSPTMYSTPAFATEPR